MAAASAHELMSVAELAQLLNVSRAYVVRVLLCKHAFRPVVMVGGRRYVLRAKAEAYHLKRQKIARRALRELSRTSQEAGLYSLTGLHCPVHWVPPPRRTGGQVLFLDFDGVLHPKSVFFQYRRGPFLLNAPGHRLFEHAELLEQVLSPYPNICIVLSTSWVRRYKGSIAKVARRLTPGLQARVVGATYHSCMDAVEFGAASRGMQVWSDVLRRRPDAWLALDDDFGDWPDWCRDNLVETDAVLGISAPAVLAELRAKLAAMHGEQE